MNLLASTLNKILYTDLSSCDLAAKQTELGRQNQKSSIFELKNMILQLTLITTDFQINSVQFMFYLFLLFKI